MTIKSDQIDFGHWESDIICEDNILPFGFIYKITNLQSGKKYIGKKQCITTLKRPPLKGKKNKRHTIKETDWREYTSSSNKLNIDIVELGKQNFKFEIIKFCDSKWQLSYEEAKIQFAEEVLLKEEYYNGIINCRIGKGKSI
tara:strand:- start:135 stop:560 length:426 start_codon:yes stop_codon:yes gene_type:complete